MKYRLLIIAFVILFSACKQGGTGTTNTKETLKKSSPRELFPELFEAVQSSGIFPDSKTFTDCTPKRSPADIIKDYKAQKDKPGFKLKAFVAHNFGFPATAANKYKSGKESVEAHIEQLWDVLARKTDKYDASSSLISLPNPYIVPGGRFREVYYWDSYFTMLGLKQSGRVSMIEYMVNNFAWLIRNYGFIPNGNRTYYLTRSQPPYFSLMVQLLMQSKPSKADSVLTANKDALEKEYRFWMDDKKANVMVSAHVVHLPGGAVLNRFYDSGDWPREEAYTEDIATAAASGRAKPEVYRQLRSGAESGWDFSSRWFADEETLKTIRTTDIVPVDLNCLLYNLELLLAHATQLDNNEKACGDFTAKAEKRKQAIIKYCWDAKTGWYRDYNWKQAKQSTQLTLAGVYPLFFKIASQEQSGLMAKVLQKKFLKPGGLVTTLAFTHQQWDAPNGWAPLQWVAIEGLKNYQQQALSNEIASRWSRTNIRVFKQTGKLLEKYNVIDTTLIAGGGEYPTQDGFGWTNGVLISILKQKP
ncbi:alpha,alpha-trehalase TreF [Mucilaginibacter gynuensis]|uniref:Alpha,alpha-trehalase TreF n=1 Tax=Mucilaginibacter gynuensis TaxID=1302236 RepID=A0ABP8G069_9SPHI